MQITERGEEALVLVRARHEAWLRTISPDLADLDLVSTNLTLARILDALDSSSPSS